MGSQGPFFRCQRCDTIDLPDAVESAVARYNLDRGTALPVVLVPLVCTRCLTGDWHGQFPQERYRPGVDKVINPPTPGFGTTV